MLLLLQACCRSYARAGRRRTSGHRFAYCAITSRTLLPSGVAAGMLDAPSHSSVLLQTDTMSWQLACRALESQEKSISRLFALYDEVEAICQESLAKGYTGSGAPEILNELRARFVRLVRNSSSSSKNHS